eukprot:Nk52_evm24s225 gene=Nk52_evmTU24s225
MTAPIESNETKSSSTHVLHSEVSVCSNEDSNSHASESSNTGKTISFLDLFRFADKVDVALYIFGFMGVLVFAASPLAFAILFGKLIDNFNLWQDGSYSDAKFEEEMDLTCILLVVVGIALFIGDSLAKAGFKVSAARQACKFRFNFLAAIMMQDIETVTSREMAEASNILNGNADKLQAAVNDNFSSFLTSAFNTVFVLIYSFVIDWTMPLVMMAMTPILMAVLSVTSNLYAKVAVREQELLGLAGKMSENSLLSIMTIISQNGQYEAIARYRDVTDQILTNGKKKALVQGLMMGSVFASIFITWAIGFMFGAYRVSEGYMTAGDVVAVFFALVMSLTGIGNKISFFLAKIASAKAAVSDNFALIDQMWTEIEEEGATVLLPSARKNVVFHNVHFSYPQRPQKTVLNGISFDIPQYSYTAFVGESGSGKSTILSLLERLYEVKRGHISIGEADIQSLDIKSLRSQIGYVAQEPVLFNMSIRENILLGDPSKNLHDVEEAAKAAGAYDFINALPERFETNVGSFGGKLSGGQKQRIAIARELIKKPSILVLDEATSALDNYSESLIVSTIESLRQHCTVIAVAHRLSTIQRANRIYVLADGKIVESGNHESLLKGESTYAKLWNMQTKKQEREVAACPFNDKSYEGKTKMSISKEDNIVAIPDLRSAGSSGDFEQNDNENAKSLPCCSAKKEDGSGLSYILRMAMKEWGYYLCGSFGSIILGVIGPLFAIAFAHMIDVLTKPRDDVLENAYPWSLAFLGCAIIAFVFCLAKDYALVLASEILVARIRESLHRSIMMQDGGWFEKEGNAPGALSTRLNMDPLAVQNILGGTLSLILTSLAAVVVGLVVAFLNGWELTLIVAVAIPLIIAVLQLSTFVSSKIDQKLRDILAAHGAFITEIMENIAVITTLHCHQHFTKAYSKKLKDWYIVERKKAIVTSILSASNNLIVLSMFSISFYFGSQLVLKNEMNFLNMMTVFSSVLFSAQMAASIASYVPDLSKAKVAANEIVKILQSKPVIHGSIPDEDMCKNNVMCTDQYDCLAIEFKDVSFKYDNREDSIPTLDAINFKAKQGEVIAFVGESGSGKSTIIKLIERFYDFDKGECLIGGKSYTALDVFKLRNSIGYVGQQPDLVGDTFKDCLLFGNSQQPSERQIANVVNACCLKDLFDSLPEGLDTKVESSQGNVSGGQKQKIAIARALLRSPSILLLDEATSALDNITEQEIIEAVRHFQTSMITLLVTHRVSLLQLATQTISLKNGKVQSDANTQ